MKPVEWPIVVAAAVALSVVFWAKLWTGGGLIGGDIYSYFFPQKQLYAESLRAGEIPLWNNRTSFGYPLIAESQTGAFYPPHLVLYRLLDLNSAYNANQLLHYVLAFVFTWLLARELKLSAAGAALAATVFTYGWSPPRISLEWAIIGAAWMPLAIWWTERFLSRCDARWLVGLSATLALQMLAGHYNLAFITQLLVVCYAGLRIWFCRADSSGESKDAAKPLVGRWRRGLSVVLAVALGGCLAAPQLVPSWELKRTSQRETIDGQEFDPGHGHIPPLYLSQVIASWWFWYAPEVDRDQALRQLDTLAISSGTNQTEAHLYFGLVPLLIIGLALASTRAREQLWHRDVALWLLLSLAAVIYATGWLLPVTQHLPGFGFFRGPGRYGIVTTLGVALIAGRALSALLERKRCLTSGIVLAIVLCATISDLKYVARVVAVSPILDQPVLARLEHSIIRQRLEEYDGLPRLYAPGPNLPNLLGVSSVPEYLGIGPSQYYDPKLRAPQLETLTPDFIAWAERSGITHILSFDPLATDAVRGVQLVLAEPDAFLNPAWARSPEQPLYLYELASTRGRAYFDLPQAGQKVDVISDEPGRVELSVVAPEAAIVILTDLAYRGWKVTVDGQPSEALAINGLFRGVELPVGNHRIEWTFEPRSLRVGFVLTAIGLVVCVAVFARSRARRLESQSRSVSN
ncbi:YfhO family protein [bacterium]|nr:YfhO family protein [bacterium]